jgi:hypothetical protein
MLYLTLFSLFFYWFFKFLPLIVLSSLGAEALVVSFIHMINRKSTPYGLPLRFHNNLAMGSHKIKPSIAGEVINKKTK